MDNPAAPLASAARPHAAVRREDYRPPAWAVPAIRLDVDLDPAATRVRARLDVRRNRDPLAPQEPLLEFDRTEHPIRQAILTEPIEHEGGRVRVPEGPGLGIEIDREALMKAHQLYLDNDLGTRNDAIAMQYLIPGWKFDGKRPCLVR